MTTECGLNIVTSRWCLYVISGGDTWASRALSTISSGWGRPSLTLAGLHHVR